LKTLFFGALLAPLVLFAQSDLVNAPPSFSIQEKKIVPVDFQGYRLQITLNAATQKAVGEADIDFVAGESGYPMLDLVPTSIHSVTLDGAELGSQGMPLITDPHRESQFRMVNASVTEGSVHHLKVSYELGSTQLSFTGGGVRFGWFMSDLSIREYLEQYAPANFEFDAYPMKLSLRLEGATRRHQLFTNGTVVSATETEKEIEFPAYFTSSSFYLHLTDRNFQVATGTYKGMERDIPVVTYFEANEGFLELALETLKELEGTYGPYAHQSLTVYGTRGGGGMEHCGATMSSRWALQHEITHSWFARGVMPANGNAGWIDEAVASWRDDGYPTGDGNLDRGGRNMAGFSPYHRDTSRLAYDHGVWVLSQIENLMQGGGGLKSVLRDLYLTKKRTVVTTPFFEKFLEEKGRVKVGAIFDKFVYGKQQAMAWERTPFHGFASPRHPIPYTKEERAQLR
jgi:hypothetical protein